jgi:hypothetical protein
MGIRIFIQKRISSNGFKKSAKDGCWKRNFSKNVEGSAFRNLNLSCHSCDASRSTSKNGIAFWIN